MNLVIATLKSTAANPSLSDERREAAISQLREIAGDSTDPRATDAALVLGGLEVCTESVQAAFEPRQARDASDPSHPDHPDHFWFLFAESKNRKKEFYERAKDDGLSAAETVAKFRQENPSPTTAATYGILTAKAEACRQGGEHAAKTYFCPEVYRLLRETDARSPYDWPARELAEKILSEWQYEPTEKEKNVPIL